MKVSFFIGGIFIFGGDLFLFVGNNFKNLLNTLTSSVQNAVMDLGSNQKYYGVRTVNKIQNLSILVKVSILGNFFVRSFNFHKDCE